MRTTRPIQSYFSSLVTKLLPACENDLPHAARELRWMVEGIIQRRSPSAHLFPRAALGRIPAPCELSPELARLEVDERCTQVERKILERWVEDRVIRKKPLQYILGTHPFCGLEFRVKSPVLIPRWETEEIVLRLIDELRPYLAERRQHSSGSRPFRILDLCTGSGCIALSLAYYLPQGSAHVTAVDISSSALQLARVNQRRLGVSPSILDIRWADLWDDGVMQFLPKSSNPAADNTSLESRFDLIISNPPYVSESEYAALTDDVKLWEDEGALVAAEEGTAFYSRIANCAKRWLLNSSASDSAPSLPSIVFEIGSSQGARVKDILEGKGFEDVSVIKDLTQRDRCVYAR
ncbi:S-adenosyl-L-methionine-dependent methyltransferase [Gaertneriomyces semiglobifer]|nr:S-adenosyl-L-methionine-dependent methyltransferase [Gaertneriomyces semiglobifer]